MGKVNIKQLNVAPASGYVIGSGAGGVPVWKTEVTSVAWNQITGNQALVNLSGFTNDSGFITLGSLSAGTGISYNNLTGVITNSAPDQTVALTQGTGITITGTYPNFTIASNGNQTITLTGDVTGSGTTGIVTTIAANVVSDSKIGLRAALSVMGRDTNVIGNVADIVFSTNNGVLHRSGTSLVTGLLTGSSISATNNQVFVGSGGVAFQDSNLTFDGTTLSATSIINATTGFRVASAATSGNYLRGNGTNFVSSAIQAGDLPAASVSKWTTTGSDIYRNSKVRIGSTVAPTATLEVRSGGNTSATFAFAIDNSSSQSMFAVKDDRKVGINTFSPTNTLHIDGLSVNTSAFRIGFGGGGAYFRAGADNDCEFGGGYEVVSGAFTARSTSGSGVNFYQGGTYFIGNTGLTSGNTFSPTYRVFISPTGQLAVGTTSPSASAILQSNSTTQGWLPPRMTATQGSAIASPAEGLMIYVTDTNGTFTSKGFWGYTGAAWEKLNN